MRKPIIAGMVYEKSFMMIAADPGLGKSIVALQAAAELSCALPVFGCLDVPEPRITYHIQLERDASEIFERLAMMEKVIPINYDKLFIDDQLKGINVLKDEHVSMVLSRIKKYCPRPDMIQIDPAYGAVAGGLRDDIPASMFTRFSTILQHELGCSNWINHHTVKDSYSSFTGDKIKKNDPFYGSQWLKAHVTASFYMSARGNGEGVLLEKKKDSHSNLLDEIVLTFDPVTCTSQMDINESKINKRDKLLLYLRACCNSGSKPTVKAMSAASKMTVRYVMELLNEEPFKSHLLPKKDAGKATVFEVRRGI